MLITKTKIAALVVFLLVTTLALVVLQSLDAPGLGFCMAVAVSLLGLALVWLAEPLGEIACFSRGVPVPSPPGMIQAFGWIFLIGYPVLLTWLVQWPPVH